MPKRILVLTNMGPTKSNPYQGMFVFRQADAIANALNDDDSIRLFSMPSWLGEKPSWLKYPVWLCLFILCHSWRRYTHLHVHFFMPTAYLAVLYKKLHAKTRLFATFHGTDIYAYMPPSQRYLKLVQHFEYLILVSQQLKKRLSDFYTGKNTEVLAAGIPNIYQPGEQDYDKRTNDYLFVGNLTYTKGADRLLEFARALPSEHTLIIAGEGEYKTQLSELAEQKPNIQVLGAQRPEQLVSLYRSSKWLINLSRYESFGLVMTEAMACGTPVLATPTDGSMEQVGKHNGIIIKVDGVKTFVPECLPTCESWVEMSDASVHFATKHKLSNIVKRLLALYQ